MFLGSPLAVVALTCSEARGVRHDSVCPAGSPFLITFSSGDTIEALNCGDAKATLVYHGKTLTSSIGALLLLTLFRRKQSF